MPGGLASLRFRAIESAEPYQTGNVALALAFNNTLCVNLIAESKLSSHLSEVKALFLGFREGGKEIPDIGLVDDLTLFSKGLQERSQPIPADSQLRS